MLMHSVNEYSHISSPGLHCEVNIDECSSVPCQNDGTCVDNVNGYTCKCHKGVFGKDKPKCSKTAPLQSFPVMASLQPQV